MTDQVSEKFILDRILAAKTSLGFMDADMCSALHIQRNSVTEWRTGKSKTFLKLLPQIAEYLDVPIGYFYGDVDVYFAIGTGEKRIIPKKLPDNEQQKWYDDKGNPVSMPAEVAELAKLRTNQALTALMREIAREVYREESTRKSKD